MPLSSLAHTKPLHSLLVLILVSSRSLTITPISISKGFYLLALRHAHVNIHTLYHTMNYRTHAHTIRIFVLLSGETAFLGVMFSSQERVHHHRIPYVELEGPKPLPPNLVEPPKPSATVELLPNPPDL